MIFFELPTFFYNFGFPAKNWTSGDFFSTRFPKLHSLCPEKIFDEKIFPKYIILHDFWLLSESFWTFDGELSVGLKNCILRLRRNFFRKNRLFLETSLQVNFGVSATQFTGKLMTFLTVFQKQISTSPETHFCEEMFFEKSISLYDFCTLIKKFDIF